ncbi:MULTISPECIES: thioesterase II family protein [unclassified Streptomyces]|uniref:thioesterase II family protein n=1 Tax=unclassified Streptomyces TaxID=2593676 RepID=UPI00278BDAE3|nr:MULTISPECIES: alpha/beta fold hydrolase [unclassified Streptomyces]
MALLTSPRPAWTAVWAPAPVTAPRLFCLPHTGGGASVYRHWALRLSPDIEVVSVRLPGRESRLRERPYDRLSELVPALVDAVAGQLDRPHAWFGHSMGALVAFEVCRELARRGLPQPVRLLVAGRRAPHLPSRSRPVHAAPAEELLAHLAELNGTPDELMGRPKVLAAVLPRLRADFAVSETYRFRPGPPLGTPITVLGGVADPEAHVPELRAWQAHTRADCPVRLFPGDHFFLHQDPEPVISTVARELFPTSPPPAGGPR